jgi:hypothetical protein
MNYSVTFKNYWYAGVFAQLAPFKTYDFYESRVGRIFEQVEYVYANLNWSSDARKRFYVQGNFEWAESPFPNDPLYAAGITPALRLGDRFTVSHEIFVSHDNSNPGYIYHTSIDSVFFGRRIIDRVVNTFSAQYTFNPKTTFAVRARHYWTRLTYNRSYFLNIDGSLTEIPLVNGFDTNFDAVNLDAVFTWQFAPGSFMTLTWKNAIFHSDDQARYDYFDNARHTWKEPKSNQFSVKMIYYLDYVKVRGWVNR